jgi:uncharacterized integral membrane protein
MRIDAHRCTPLPLRLTSRWRSLSRCIGVPLSSPRVPCTACSVFELFGFFARWEFVLYAIVVAVFITVLYLAIARIEIIEREDGITSTKYLQYKALHRFAYPALSGTVGAQSVLFAKCVVELSANTVRHFRQPDTPTPEATQTLVTVSSLLAGAASNATSIALPGVGSIGVSVSQNMFVHWQSYLVLILMLLCIFAQIKYLNDGLRRFDASYSVPVFTSFWILLSVVSGMIFYRSVSVS